jgi:hypothetical protein
VFDGEHVIAFVIGVASTHEAFRQGVGRLFGEWWRAAKAAAALRRQPERLFGDTEA